jgi:uncharacterized membrane protein
MITLICLAIACIAMGYIVVRMDWPRELAVVLAIILVLVTIGVMGETATDSIYESHVQWEIDSVNGSK